VITEENKVMALDGKISLDDNALGRHPELQAMHDPSDDDPAEVKANEAGLSYINLDGEIGCLVNGAGLAMATMDIVKYFGGEPANFLDLGGGAGAEKVTTALGIILGDKRVKAVLINIFGGITRCDNVAKGFLEAINTIETDVPFVIRLVGTNDTEGRKILADANLENVITATSLSDAAQKAVAAAKGESA